MGTVVLAGRRARTDVVVAPGTVVLVETPTGIEVLGTAPVGAKAPPRANYGGRFDVDHPTITIPSTATSRATQAATDHHASPGPPPPFFTAEPFVPCLHFTS